METLVKLLRILLFAVTVTGEPPAMYPTQLSAEGDDVTLQCRLDPPINLSAFTVDWTRPDNKDIVHVYRHQHDDPGPQTDQYRGRTTLLHGDLIRGVLTLQLSSVKLSDSGPHKGFVPNLKTSCVVDLIVVRKDQQNETKTGDSSTTGPPEEEKTEPGGPGGGNRNAGRAGIISSVFVILCLVVVVLLLRMNRTIQCVKRIGVRKEQKPETASNGSEGKKLNTQAADGDLEGLAGNNLGNIDGCCSSSE